MIARFFRVFVPTLALAALSSACAGPTVMHAQTQDHWLNAIYEDAVGGKAVLVTIVGDPFDEGADAVQRAVIEALPLDLPSRTDPKAYTTDPERADKPTVRLAIALGTDPRDATAGVCEGGMKTARLRPGSPMTLAIALCQKDTYAGWQPVSRARVKTEPADGITAPSVAAALKAGVDAILRGNSNTECYPTWQNC